jgi:hypothetical protein
VLDGRDAWTFLPSVASTTITPLFASGDASENPRPIGMEFTAKADDSIDHTHYVMQMGGMAALMELAFAEHRAAICRLIGVDVDGLPVDDPSQTEIIAKQSKLLYDLREELRKANERIDAALAVSDSMEPHHQLVREALYGTWEG